jgi:ribonuclease Z
MDHFIGFDHVLRILLGRDKDLYLYGPQGFLKNLEGKLAGYCWNLVDNYQNRFILHAAELHPDHRCTRRYACHKGFCPDGPVVECPFDGVALQEPGLTIRAVHLDHGTPVLGFALRERFHINIDKTALDRMELIPGPWLNRLKDMIYGNFNPCTVIAIPRQNKNATPMYLTVKALQDAIVIKSPGQTLAYITDVAGTRENLKRITVLAKGVDHLFVEAAFSEKHRDIAIAKKHLTARMAGELASACGARHFSVFHFSPRYSECPKMLEEEAVAAFHVS